MSRTPFILATSVALALASGASSAAIINVPADQPTMQSGIGQAAPGDTVLVAPGTYYETTNFLGKPVTVGSWYLTTGDPAHVSSTVIDGGGTSGPLATFVAGEDSLSVLAGLTLRNGRALRGGAVFCQLSAPRISDCVFLSNEASSDGGAIYADQGSPIVEGSRFETNEATSHSGGGFGVRNGSPRIEGCVFSGNVAHDEGGAIFCEDSSPVIRDNVIDGNTSTVTYAGGIMSRDCTSVVVGNVISNNHTNGCGGGMFY